MNLFVGQGSARSNMRNILLYIHAINQFQFIYLLNANLHIYIIFPLNIYFKVPIAN